MAEWVDHRVQYSLGGVNEAVVEERVLVELQGRRAGANQRNQRGVVAARRWGLWGGGIPGAVVAFWAVLALVESVALPKKGADNFGGGHSWGGQPCGGESGKAA